MFFFLPLLALLELPGAAASQEVSQEVSQECYQGEEASWELKRWVLTEVAVEEEEEEEERGGRRVKFYETEMFHLQPGGPGSASWYLLGDGWQGAYYYPSPSSPTSQGEERAGLYLYPDYYTAVLGQWRQHVLQTGQVTVLLSACREGAGWSLSWASPQSSSPAITYSPPSHFSYGVSPTSTDPYEARTVTVARSGTAEANEGLFTVREVLAGEVVAFYSGLIINCESSLRALDRRELSDEEEHERNMYNIALDLGETDTDNLCIDIPPEMGGDTSKYSATLAHKVNHNFQPNSEFVLFSAHPVLGTIMAITALEDLEAGVEITVNYGYNFTAEPDQPQWFKALWLEHYGDDEESGESGHQEL